MDRIKTADFKLNQPKMELGPHRRYFDFFESNVKVAEQALTLFVVGSNPPSRTTIRNGLMAGRLALDQKFEVRILVPEPT
jgi:hypothetical protein